MQNPFRVLLLVLSAVAIAPSMFACGDKDGEGDSAEDSTTTDDDSGSSSGESCVCSEATLVPGYGCEEWPDADECSGWGSVFCENVPDQCSDDAFDASIEFSSGSQFSAYGCTICLDCGDGACEASMGRRIALDPMYPECIVSL